MVLLCVCFIYYSVLFRRLLIQICGTHIIIFVIYFFQIIPISVNRAASPIMIQRALHTPADLHDHAQRVGIRLHSNIGSNIHTCHGFLQSAHDNMSPRTLQTYIAQRTPRTQRARSSPLYHGAFNINSSTGQPTEYIQNVITPVNQWKY